MTSDLHEKYFEAEGFWSDGALEDVGNRKRIERTIDLIPRETKTVLDVGCGNGVFGNALLERRPAISLRGVDRSETAMRYAKFPTHSASIADLPFEDGAFDLVSCLEVIEHLPNTIYAGSLAELARVSRRYIVIGVPYEENLERDLTQCPQCKTKFNLNLHVRSFSVSDLEQLFAPHGFRMADFVFPVQRTRKKYVNEIAGMLKSSKVRNAGFRSPICPICAYTNSSGAAVAPKQERDELAPGSRSTLRSLAKSVFSAATALFPEETIKGYWIVALFERPA